MKTIFVQSFDLIILIALKRFIKSDVKLMRLLSVDYDIYQLKRLNWFILVTIVTFESGLKFTYNNKNPLLIT